MPLSLLTRTLSCSYSTSVSCNLSTGSPHIREQHSFAPPALFGCVKVKYQQSLGTRRESPHTHRPIGETAQVKICSFSSSAVEEPPYRRRDVYSLVLVKALLCEGIFMASRSYYCCCWCCGVIMCAFIDV